jgi:two-component system sensor histidine kinase UhpB
MSEAEIHLAKGGVDIVLLDMGLPDGHGLDTVRRAHRVAPDVPMIVLTGLDDEALAAEAMKEGAQDYLIKGQIENRALPGRFAMPSNATACRPRLISSAPSRYSLKISSSPMYRTNFARH